MKTVKCHICGCENEISASPSFCGLCGADLVEPQAETMSREPSHTAAYATIDSASPISDCTICLTSKRLIVIPAKVKMEGFGLKGVAMAAVYNKVYDKMTKNLGIISLPLENVKSVKASKFGLFRKAIVISTADGEIVKLAAPKLNEWQEAITKSAVNLR